MKFIIPKVSLSVLPINFNVDIRKINCLVTEVSNIAIELKL
jgi:hypothetical protein